MRVVRSVVRTVVHMPIYIYSSMRTHIEEHSAGRPHSSMRTHIEQSFSSMRTHIEEHNAGRPLVHTVAHVSTYIFSSMRTHIWQYADTCMAVCGSIAQL